MAAQIEDGGEVGRSDVFKISEERGPEEAEMEGKVAGESGRVCGATRRLEGAPRRLWTSRWRRRAPRPPATCFGARGGRRHRGQVGWAGVLLVGPGAKGGGLAFLFLFPSFCFLIFFSIFCLLFCSK